MSCTHKEYGESHEEVFGLETVAEMKSEPEELRDEFGDLLVRVDESELEFIDRVKMEPLPMPSSSSSRKRKLK